MKILLLNPSHSQKKLSTDPILTRCTGVPSKAPYIWPPIGLAYVASALRGVSEVEILDAQADGFDIGTTNGFDLVVINAGTPTIDYDIRLSQEIRDLNGPRVALIGVHAAYFHKELVKHCDFVVRGEPDTVLVNLVRCLEGKGDIGSVKGITWRDGERIHVNRDERPVEDLDSLPFQAIDLLPDKYFDITAKRKPVAFMITSRGCPFQCRFCSAKFYSGKYRYRSAMHVFREMKLLRDWGFRDITFFDDSFTISRKRVMDLCDLIKKEELDVSWRCLSRVDTVDREMLQGMRDSGCYQIQFGVESGDQRMLDLMKKATGVDRIRETFRVCDEIGLETVGFFMFGYPGETPESIRNTVNLSREIKPDFVTFNLFTPLPGSETFESFPRKEWDRYDFTSTSFCDIDSERMAEAIKEAYRNYYFRPSYVFRRMSKTKEPLRIIKQNVNFWRKRSGILWDFIKS